MAHDCKDCEAICDCNAKSEEDCKCCSYCQADEYFEDDNDEDDEDE